jgi:hypothetical protein
LRCSRSPRRPSLSCSASGAAATWCTANTRGWLRASKPDVQQPHAGCCPSGLEPHSHHHTLAVHHAAAAGMRRYWNLWAGLTTAPAAPGSCSAHLCSWWRWAAPQARHWYTEAIKIWLPF